MNRLEKKQNEDLIFWKTMLEYIIENDPNAIAVLDKNMCYMFASKRYIKDFHINTSDIIGKSHYDLFPDIPEQWRQVHQRVLQGSVEKSESEVFSHKDGSIDYTRYQLRPWYTQDGTVGGIILYLEVINERKKQEMALHESEESFRLLVETAPDAIFLLTEKKIAYANHAAMRMLRATSAQDIIGQELLSLVHTTYREAETERYRVLFEERNQVPPMEQLYVLPDGTEISVEVIANPILYKNSEGALIYVRDISERKKLEQKRLTEVMNTRHQQKLESIGTLASGVAHEINNPIMGIINYAQLIQEETSNDQIKAYAKEILDEGNRIAEITGNLLFYSRQQKQAHSPAMIEDVIQRTLSLIQGLLKKDQIEVVLHIPEDLPLIRCRSQQIQQILMNLLTNARDALNEKYKGKDPNKQIVISVFLFTEEERRWIRITVKDHGNGIPKEYQDQIFDPFFTTKPRDVGTGLGLSISFGLALDHHGRIEFDTVEGQYTQFHLILPVDNGWDMKESL